MARKLARRTVLTGAAAMGAAAGLAPRTALAKGGGKEHRVDVVVVGGGFAGLNAATLLRARRRKIVLLEANDRLGGRVLNMRVGPGPDQVTEAGGEWISQKQPHVWALKNRLGLKTFKNYTRGKSTLIWDGEVTRFDGTTVPELPGGGTVDAIAGLLELADMASQVKVAAPWEGPHAQEWDTQTADTWLQANIESEAARQLLAIGVGGAVGVQPQDFSLLHYLFIAASSGGPFDLITLGSGNLEFRVVGGTGALVDGLARPLANLIRLKTPVTAIEHGGSTVRVTTTRGAYVADHVILAMSPSMTQQILFEPMLPVPRIQSIQRTGMASVIKFFPVYPRPFWRDRGFNGIVQSNSTPFSGVFDNTPPSGAPGVLFALVEAAKARRMSTLSAAERKKEILDGLALAFGEEARHPTRFLELDWSSEPWIRGGAASFFAPGVLTEFRYLFGTPIGRLHFAASDTATPFWGSIEGAMASGERAAKETL